MDILALVLFLVLMVLLLHVVRGGQKHFSVLDNNIVYPLVFTLVLAIMIVWLDIV